MVNLRAAMLWVLCGFASAPAGAALQAQLSATQSPYGQPVTLSLHDERNGGELQRIDLTPLQADFQLQRTTLSEDGRTLSITLNPRRAGTLHIPPLGLAGQHSDTIALQVTEATDLGRVLHVHTESGPLAVWQRQQILVTVSVRSSDRYFELRAPPFAHPGWNIDVLSAREHSVGRDGTTQTVRTAGWALYPQSPGKMQLELPAVEYVRGGRVQARFALQRVQTTVRPLPPYVPADMPVGRLGLATHLDAPALLEPGRLQFWHVRLRAEGVAANALPTPLAPVRDDASVQFLPAEEQRSNLGDSDVPRAEASYRVPFVARASGLVTLPALHVQYFDPDSGRIVRVSAPGARLWALGLPWRVGIGLAVLFATAYAIFVTGRWVRRLRARRRRRAWALEAIGAATCARQIRLALHRFGLDEGWPLDGSLGTWARQFARRYRSQDEALERFCTTLNRLEFGPTADDANLRPLQDTAAQLLRARRRRSLSWRGYSAWFNSRSAIPSAAPR